MLTKQERAAIAESLKKYGEGGIVLYDCLLGVCVPRDTSPDEDRVAIANRIIDLCDTSNMIELPVDKDGEVIRIGDTVYKGFDRYTVTGYVTTSDSTRVTLSAGKYSFDDTVDACYLTHKAPVTVKLLAQQVKNLADSERGYIPSWTFEKLVDIAENLESLGDDNE